MTPSLPTTRSITGYEIHALPTAAVDQVRTTGVDAAGNPVERVSAGGGEPLRCCLRGAVAGEELILFGYEPPIPAGPYREVGPVFAHAEPCEGPQLVDGYPPEWIGRPQVLRAYDERGWIHGSTQVHDGSDPAGLISQMLADPDVVQIHSRNVAYGCFMFQVTRAAAPDGLG